MRRCTVTKNIWIGLIVLLVVLACGVLEVLLLGNEYKLLAEECGKVLDECDQGTLSLETFEDFRAKWVKLRETSEIFLPHTDVYEINLRFAEAQAYVEQGDFKQVEAQLTVVMELLQYVPHLMTPNFRHIV